jgi:hypothetical protein
MVRAFDQRHRRRYLMVVVIVAALVGLDSCIFAHETHAHCSARAVMENYAKLKPAAPRPVELATTSTPVWRTISLGTTPSTFALRNALDAANCGVGDLAEQILARPAFTIRRTPMEVDLVPLSGLELGFHAKPVPLTAIYERARKLGFELAPAEIGPQLRLQYADQPIGEFLHIAMEPIRTWNGEPVIFVVANGGAGLILIGQQVAADTEVPATSRFVFVHRRDIAEAGQSEAVPR